MTKHSFSNINEMFVQRYMIFNNLDLKTFAQNIIYAMHHLWNVLSETFYLNVYLMFFLLSLERSENI